MIGMRPGGTRVMTIAPGKAFGPEGNEDLSVPPNATIQISESSLKPKFELPNLSLLSE